MNKREVAEHVARHYPVQELIELGQGLGEGVWDNDEVLGNLAVVLHGLRTDHPVISREFGELEDATKPLVGPDMMPKVLSIVRKGIFYRNLTDDEQLPGSFDEVLNNTLSGVVDDDGRDDATGAAILLTSFLNGLAVGGYPLERAKQIMRDDIEDVMQRECDGRSSFSAIGATKFMYRVMAEAKLHNRKSRVLWMRRALRLSGSYGIQLD